MWYVDDILERNWLTNNGPLVCELESRIAEYLGVRHCVAMCNGTIALEVAIRAVGMSGEVIVPSYTFVATAHAVSWQGLHPVFADVRRQDHCIDPEAVRRAITPRTTGIVATHLWGGTCDIAVLQKIAQEHGLKLVFDAAHAFGCSYDGQRIGGFGDAEVFSFHATKFFNTIEGGAVTTNDDALADQLRLMRNFGFAGQDKVIHPGTNGKMTEVNAAMGLVNLDAVDAVMATNKARHAAYSNALENIAGLRLTPVTPDEERNHQYVVLEIDASFPRTRDEVLDALTAENILARKYFWPGCHRMEPYRSLQPNAGRSLPVTEDLAERVIVLPTGPNMPREAISVVREVCQVLSGQVIGRTSPYVSAQMRSVS
ncbi:aminotransferase class I/II-fold pyridoxal phosphate-dependent enzyme [Epibacterium sp. Ofav1-8]|uniref:aminotransferase class I/II-fold pyridoxal phosphate-dependent enzyme n=1 Tax=Epibacterium sp. Ofav1-8 TaxID=2917735 RepID=UPI001EF6BB8C|nr:aminotransferase class I/II-fold pyridoxal phosphate-dependent enzyme [Epibacterium sp. Ofav1-8]MCG7626017.1 aminotransferase class I/II-fold pyridoxal phosphate-dependent enzyme [Epibacterium sp. Ofav1-8]